MDPSTQPVPALAEPAPTSSPPVARRACLIVNPGSGVSRTDERNQFDELWSSLRGKGIWTEVLEIQPGQSAGAIARQAVASGFDQVIAAGGDGTVSEVAKELVGKEATLGILPLGTYNNCARSLGLPVDFRAAGEVLARGQVRRIDVGLANDEHLFFEAAGVGIDASLFPLGEEFKSSHWWSPRPVLKALQVLFRFQPTRIAFEFDRSIAQAHVSSSRRASRRSFYGSPSRRFDLKAFLVIAANGNYYGSNFGIAPHAVLDDGLFDVSVYRRFSKTELIRHFVSLYRGQRRYDPRVDTFRVAELRLSSKLPLNCHVDGQPIGTLPLTLKVLPRALKVIA